MGRPAWDVMRKKIYAKHEYTCAACGVHSRKAIIKQYLEAHELFEINWQTRNMKLIGMEPLCHACHSFIHSGLLEVRLMHRKVTPEHVATILGHGVGILEASGLRVPPSTDHLCKKLGLQHGMKVSKAPRATGWRGWSMTWEGKNYPALYNSESEWQSAMRKQGVN
jgi:hypothetical protein